jgi:YD repeat-containing protein
MTITDFSGPIIVFQDGGILTNDPANQNPDQGPSLFLQATGLLDPRAAYTFFPGMGEGPIGFSSTGSAIAAAPAVGWINATFQVADYAPGTASTTSLSAVSTISSTTTLQLRAASATNITTGSSCVNPQTGATVTGLWLIDSKPANITFGQSGAVAIWDPANPAIGRAVSLTSTGDVSGVNFTVNGYDAYGNPISQTMAGGTTSTSVYTSKTFKWVSSVTASTTSSTTLSVGVADIYGFPMFAGAFAYIDMYWSDKAVSAMSSNATFSAGTTLTTAGAGDVRGTMNFVANTASNGTIKMQLWQSVSPARINTAAGLFGVTPA